MADLPEFDGVVFRMFRGATDYQHFVRIINVSARADGDDRVETAEALASAYDHLDRCDPERDLLVAEVGGIPVAYSRVWWDEEANGPLVYRQVCFLDPEFGGRGIGGALLGWNEARLREIAPEHGASEQAPRSLGERPERRRDGADPRRRLRARHVHGGDGQADRRRPARSSAPRGSRDPSRSPRPT